MISSSCSSAEILWKRRVNVGLRIFMPIIASVVFPLSLLEECLFWSWRTKWLRRSWKCDLLTGMHCLLEKISAVVSLLSSPC